jgi:hypothetical protein
MLIKSIGKRVKNYALKSMKQASTWKGIASFIVAALGYTLTDAQLEAAGLAGAAVYAFLSIVLPDKLGEPESLTPPPTGTLLVQKTPPPLQERTLAETTSSSGKIYSEVTPQPEKEITPGPDIDGSFRPM